MILFKKTVALTKHLQQLKNNGKTVGFVPTMGALHQGHISLIDQSKKSTDITVASIFVNPTQFNNSKDFEKYPITVSNDILLLSKSGCDILFLPSINEMYPQGTKLNEHYDLGEIEQVLEGKYRPGHFQGVCQVVHKLLSVVQPDFLFLGQKDYQQVMVIKRLVELIEAPVKVITAGTYRDNSGLALSSRNLRLSSDEKQSAVEISKMLSYIKKNYTNLPFSSLEKHAAEDLLAHGFNKVDYVSIADAETLQPATDTKNKNLVALIAAYIGEVRLIDNVVLSD
jgi:pantoate--beta-alanine ligase